MKRAQKNSSKTPQLQRPAAEENVNSVMLFSENLKLLLQAIKTLNGNEKYETKNRLFMILTTRHKSNPIDKRASYI